MSRYRIGVMGCASIAKRKVIPAIHQIKHLDLVAVASRSYDKAQEYAQLFSCEPIVGYEQLLIRDDIDIIYMPLPTGLHEQWIIPALNAGKHILVEKSLAMNYESAQNIIRHSQANNCLIMENFMFEHHSQHTYIKDLIQAGEIGEIRLLRSSFGFPPLALDNFRYNLELGGGALLDAGAYTVKVAQFFLGNKLTVQSSDLYYDPKTSVDIYGSAMLRNNHHQVAQVSFGFDNYYQCNYAIWGSKGKISLERAFTTPEDMEPCIYLEKQGEVQEVKRPQENHFINILEYFIESIELEDRRQKSWDSILQQAFLLEHIRNKAV